MSSDINCRTLSGPHIAAMASLVSDPKIDDLLVLIEEVMRATNEGVRRFIEPAPGVLARAKSSQHHMIFGRRGSGKSSLLRKTAADLTVDRRPIAFVDMETFKTHTYPDVLISVLIKSLREFDGWLRDAATTTAAKRSFWQKYFGTSPTRPPLSRAPVTDLRNRLAEMIRGLEAELHKPETVTVKKKVEVSNSTKAEAEASLGILSEFVNVGGVIERKRDHATRDEETSDYVSHKVEYLHQHILEFQRFFNDLAAASGGPSFLVLDDLYHIRRSDQPKVLDYFHRVAKGNSLWLKIGTIKHRSEWYVHGSPPVGIKLGDDANEINLDVTLEKYATCKAFLLQILDQLIKEKTDCSAKSLMNEGAVDRLVLASGGVARDLIGIFGSAIRFARDRDPSRPPGPRVGVEDVNKASGEYDTNKREEFKLDSADDRAVLEDRFNAITGFCRTNGKCNVFLVAQRASGPSKDQLDQLIDLRLIHLVRARVSVKSNRPGEIYEAYMLDLSQYTASRKIHDFHVIDLSSAEAAEQMRRSSLIYDLSSP